MSPSNISTNQPENRETTQVKITSYCKKNQKEIEYYGYIDAYKSIENVRILLLNLRGINP